VVVHLLGDVGDPADRGDGVPEAGQLHGAPQPVAVPGPQGQPAQRGGDVVGGEGFGIAYMEAAARGVAAIGGNLTGARDAIRDGETGLLVDPTDHLAVADAAVSLLADRERTAAMGAAARQWAEQHAWPLIGAEIEAAIQGVIAASGARSRRR